MNDSVKKVINTENASQKQGTPQCQYFVVRKKRLCRMTVRPGRQYCGEHEPDPKTKDGQNDTRIPCPNDPKHTCYISKLQKHLSICNARQVPLPPYIELNVNAPAEDEPPPQISLSEVPKDKMLLLIDKINKLYDKLLKDNIETIEEQEIHEVVLPDFQDPSRTESSRRHLRQASALLRLTERARLVRPDTCYIELGAGKGQLSYYAWQAWCSHGRGRVLLVDRASLRHKRDNKLRPTRDDADDDQEGGADAVCRVRASLEHLVVRRVGAVRRAARLVGLAKHLCGAATDYALRCVCGPGSGGGAGSGGGVGSGGSGGMAGAGAAGGAVVATCCHHRCRRAHLFGWEHLQEIGISAEEFEILLRIVSWATCGDGRSRERRVNDKRDPSAHDDSPRKHDDLSEAADKLSRDHEYLPETADKLPSGHDYLPEIADKLPSDHDYLPEIADKLPSEHDYLPETADNLPKKPDDSTDIADKPIKDRKLDLSVEERAEVGRRGKGLLDWARCEALRRAGYHARLCRFVPQAVSPENICIVATRPEDQNQT